MEIGINKAKYLSLKEAAEKSGYAPDYLGFLIRKGKIRGKKIYEEISWQVTLKEIVQYCSYCNPNKKIRILESKTPLLLKKKYLSLKEAAKISGYSPDYIGYLIRKGKIKGEKFYTGVSWMTTEEAVEQYQLSRFRFDHVKASAGKQTLKLPNFFSFFNLVIPQKNRIFGFGWRLAFAAFLIFFLVSGFAPIRFFQASIVAITGGETKIINFYSTVSLGDWDNFQKAQGPPEVGPDGNVSSFSEFNSAVYRNGPFSLILQNFKQPEIVSQEPIIEEGQIEEPPCEHGTNRPCSSEIGACQIGVQICEQGVWEECIGAVLPTDEICDGVDNDCDGKTDEDGICPGGGSFLTPAPFEEVISETTSTEATTSEPVSFFQKIRNLLSFSTAKAQQNLAPQDLSNLQFLSAKIKFSFAIGEMASDILFEQPIDIDATSSSEETGFWEGIKNFFSRKSRVVPMVRAQEVNENETTTDTGVQPRQIPAQEEPIEEEPIIEEATSTKEIEEVLPNLDARIIIWYSLDGEIWHELDTISQYPLSNALNGGYFEYFAPFLKSWEDVKNLKIKFEGVVGGKTNVVVYLDSVWVEVSYEETHETDTKKEHETDAKPEFELRVIKRDWRADENPEFELVETEELGIMGGLLSTITSVFESEPEIEAELSGVKLLRGEDFSTETHSPTKIKILRLGNFRPGLHKLKISFEKNGKTYNLEQDFTWGVLAINTNKSIYLPGEQAYIQMAALRDDGHTICDARLRLQILNPKSEILNLSTEDGGIQYSGECGANNVTSVPDYFAYYKVGEPGVYQMTLTKVTGNDPVTITDEFEVREEVSFDVERIGPTRIYPPATYEMTLKIKANQDFVGEVVETVPASFEILNPKSAGCEADSPEGCILNKFQIQNSNDQNTKEIIWQVAWQAEEEYELRYAFDAPDVSPYLYLLGPLEFYE